MGSVAAGLVISLGSAKPSARSTTAAWQCAPILLVEDALQVIAHGPDAEPEVGRDLRQDFPRAGRSEHEAMSESALESR